MAPLPLTGAPLTRVAATEGETSSPVFHPGSTRLFLRETWRQGHRETTTPPSRRAAALTAPTLASPAAPPLSAQARPAVAEAAPFFSFPFLPSLPPSRSRRGAMAQGSRCPHGLSPPLPFPSLSAAAITGCARAREAPSLAPPHFPHDPSPDSGRAAALGPFSRGLTPSPGDEPLPPVRSPRPVSPRGEE